MGMVQWVCCRKMCCAKQYRRKGKKNMIQISQLKLPCTHTQQELREKIERTLRIRPEELIEYSIEKQSIDARKKPQIFYVYTIHASVLQEKKVFKKGHSKNITIVEKKVYQFPFHAESTPADRPVIIGSGPAGLFCAYMLAEHGFAPILLERGKAIEERKKDVDSFWETGKLNPESNVQFGEGGAGTFSDGKLNTLVKDPSGRNRKVLEIFVKEGAPEEILYVNKPHIGTDLLMNVVKNMRKTIQSNGGEVRFESKVTELCITDGKICGVVINKEQFLPAKSVILAIGHSARDTFEMLWEKQICMEAKSFAVGVRVEHPQKLINYAQYQLELPKTLPAASYKVTAQLSNGRGVYSFCMCPGGYVVNASSEEGRLAVNGMSYHSRAGENANSAIIVTVTPKDYGSDHPLAGMEFQRKLEEKAFHLAQGKIPVQRYEDFCKNRATDSFGTVHPSMKGNYAPANVREILPEIVAASIEEGIRCFDQKLQGFADPDALLSGVESRTSSPVRISRDPSTMEGSVKGLYPCGEGAGYAGGITSAAMDGIRMAEAVAGELR